jgi:putative ABC transport system permease protein
MILSAGALAFVVLYNLTNVNISERIREIATIKVLGFYDKEVSSYIFRENILLTVLGLILGVGLGIVFHRFIMVTVEMDDMMFGRNIDFISFIFGAILTVSFSLIVNFIMYFKLKKIEMVESLKSVD